jgi:trimeric autotransporter adhesin
MFKRIGIAAVTAALLFGTALAQSATPAGTQIQNQASATYTDASGQAQVATSNLAITVVQQVYAINITPNTQSATGAFGPTDPSNFTGVPASTNDDQALGGANDNFAYTILNPGNGADTYTLTVVLDPANTTPLTGVTVYNDANGNGQVDAGDTVITGWNAGTLTGTVSVPANGNTKVVVSVNVPSIAAGTAFKLDLTGVSSGGATITDKNNLSRVTVVSDAILDLNKAAAGPDASGQITYTINGSNTGNQAAKSRPGIVVITGTNPGTYNGVLIADTIPAGTTYVQNTTSGSAGSPLALVVYSTTASGTAWSFDQPASGVLRVGLLMLPASPIATATNTSATSTTTVPTSANYSLSFKASVNAATASGSSILNTSTIDYRRTNGTTDQTTTSNQTTSIAPTTRSVGVGPNGFATGNPGAITGYTDPVTGRSFTYTGSGTGAPVNTTDTQAVPSQRMNTTVSFVQSITNTGNANDVFNITLDASSNLPVGSSVAFYLSDGATPLSSGIALSAGASTNFVVKVILPAVAAPVTGAPFNAVIKATSQADSTKTDITTDRITALTDGLGVTLVNNDTSAGTTPPAGTSATPITLTTTPGGSVNYPLVVTNTGAATDTFNLTASGAGLPSGATVQFFIDANGDGLPDNATPIGNTGPVSAAAYLQLVAVVTVPASASPQTAVSFTFTATSTDNATTQATQADALTVSAVNSFAFSPNRSGTITSPGTLVYSHAVTNNGNSNLTALQIAPTGGIAGFGYQFYVDANNNGVIDAGEQQISATAATTLTTALAPGASISILVQVSASSGIPSSTVETKTLTATGTFASGGTSNVSVVDTTTVVAGNLQVTKSASTATVKPRTLLTVGNYAQSEITYTINAQNIGSAAISNVVVLDPIPQYTDFKFGTVTVTGCPSGATCAIEYSTDNGATWTATAPTDTNANGYSDAADTSHVTNLRVRITNASSTPVNAFVPGSNVTIVFTVSVR